MTGKHHGNDVWNLWLERAKPLIPVMVIDDITDAIPMAQALVAGGVRLLEVTLRTSCALDAIRLIRQTVPDAIVGAGTVTSAAQLQAAVEQGGRVYCQPGHFCRTVTGRRQLGRALFTGCGHGVGSDAGTHGRIPSSEIFPGGGGRWGSHAEGVAGAVLRCEILPDRWYWSG